VKKILYLDMDNVLVDFESAFARCTAEELAEYDDNRDDIPGIFSRMDPMPGALEAFEVLSERFDTYLLSTGPWGNPSAWSDKLEWVKTHLGERAHKRLILSHHKNLNRGDIIVDDRVANGVADFQGEHIQFGTDRFPDWPTVLEHLLAK